MRINYLAAMGSNIGRTWLINEDCEGAGTPAGWTINTGTPDWDYTTTILAGTQSLFLGTNGVGVMTRVDFTNQSEVWSYFLMRQTGSFPGSAINFMAFRPNGGGAPAIAMSINATGRLAIGGASPVTGTTLGVTYHVWTHYKAGTGANAIWDLGYSTDGVRPTSGGTYAQITNGSQTTSLGRLELGTTAATLTVDEIFDTIRVSDAQINDNGA